MHPTAVLFYRVSCGEVKDTHTNTGERENDREYKKERELFLSIIIN